MADPELLEWAYMSVGELIFTVRKRNLGQGNVFTGVCQSFCSQGEGVLVGGGGLPDRNPPGQWSLDRDPTGQKPPRQRLPCMVKSGRYASYWNAILFTKIFNAISSMENRLGPCNKEPHETPEKWDDVLLSWKEKKNVIITTIYGWSVFDTMM